MDPDRLILLRRYYNADSVFECGVGESTKIATLSKIPRYAASIVIPNGLTQHGKAVLVDSDFTLQMLVQLVHGDQRRG